MLQKTMDECLTEPFNYTPLLILNSRPGPDRF